eukprot:3733442-Prymnesium_polylepis.2
MCIRDRPSRPPDGALLEIHGQQSTTGICSIVARTHVDQSFTDGGRPPAASRTPAPAERPTCHVP